MTENGNRNDEETKFERDEKGRFLPGGPGGPGRGKKSDLLELSDVDFMTKVKLLLRQEIMESEDMMTRQRATKLLFELDEYLKKNAKPNNTITIDPDTEEYLEFKAWKRRTAHDFGFDKKDEDED